MSEAAGVPAATESVTCCEEPAVSVNVLGEIVTPDGRVPAETEIVPVKLLLPEADVAEIVTGKEPPSAMLITAGEAAIWKLGVGIERAICDELVCDPEVPRNVREPDVAAVPAATETVICCEEPAASVNVLGEMVTPAGRLLAEIEIVPVKPLLPVADIVTCVEFPAATLMLAGDAAI